MRSLKDKMIFRFNSISRREKIPPSIEEKRKLIDNVRELYQCKTFVETGTFLGDTVEYFKMKFDKLVSIELSAELASRAKERFAVDNNITIIEGDSSIVLKKIVNELLDPTLFWLDGHFSSSFFVKDEFIQTAKGKKNTPIVEELEIILTAKCHSIILVDDARLFTGREDYPSIRTIKSLVNKYSNQYKIYVRQDIIYIIYGQ